MCGPQTATEGRKRCKVKNCDAGHDAKWSSCSDSLSVPPTPACPTNALSNEHSCSDRIFWDPIDWVPTSLSPELRVPRTLLFGPYFFF